MTSLKRCYNRDNDDNYPSKVFLLETQLGGNPENLNLINSIVNKEITCNFTPVVGQVYHLYERAKGLRYLGMLSPLEWRSPHLYLGSYLYQSENSWIAIVCNS